ncbi:MAG TPA: nickel pincer cofactor biosynthesis protein LarC [Acidimicrobiales bacterium]
MSVAWFNCFNGIAGDMALGALLDAGADIGEVRSIIELLPLTGWSLTAEPVQRNGIAATRARVDAAEQAHHRPAGEIVAMVSEAALPPRVAARAVRTFALLAEVEGRIHGVDSAEVELHEVGGVDAIIDVVGTCAALEVLDVGRVCSSAVATGSGTVRGAHGLLPNPAPAVVALLAAAGAPTHGLEVPVELATPTGVALLAALADEWGPMPAMVPSAVGYGSGSRDMPDRPNVVQVVIGTAVDASPRASSPGQPVVLLEANIDDATGEQLAHAVAALLDSGAHDAWITPIVMKKGRPAHVVSALCDVARRARVAEVMVATTGTLGLRGRTIERWPQHRHERAVDVLGQRVRVKVSEHRVKVEHDDAAAAAAVLGLSLREVVSRAEAAARDLEDES